MNGFIAPPRRLFLGFGASVKTILKAKLKMKVPLIGFLVIILLACNPARKPPVQQQEEEISHNLSMPDDDDTTAKETIPEIDYAPIREKAHPKAKRIMKEDFYWSPNEEAGPFGNDDGADAYAGFADWRRRHPQENPRKYLSELLERWNYPAFDLEETRFEKLKPYIQRNILGETFILGTDQAIQAIAFGQLYLEGTIDPEFKELAKTSIRRQLMPGFEEGWAPDYRTRRRECLSKMLEALNKVK